MTTANTPAWLDQVQQFTTSADVSGDGKAAVGSALGAIAEGMSKPAIPADANPVEWERAIKAFYSAVRMNNSERQVTPQQLDTMRAVLVMHADGRDESVPGHLQADWGQAVTKAYILSRQFDQTVPSHWLDAIRDILLAAVKA